MTPFLLINRAVFESVCDRAHHIGRMVVGRRWAVGFRPGAAGVTTGWPEIRQIQPHKAQAAAESATKTDRWSGQKTGLSA